ncbi:hypothetical protein Tco_0003501 [Tanacetum coccineum]
MVLIMTDSIMDMRTKFGKLDKFEGSDSRGCQKKMHFLFTALKVVCVLSTPMPEHVEDKTVDQTWRQCKWENDDYICQEHILSSISNALFDLFQNMDMQSVTTGNF